MSSSSELMFIFGDNKMCNIYTRNIKENPSNMLTFYFSTVRFSSFKLHVFIQCAKKMHANQLNLALRKDFVVVEEIIQDSEQYLRLSQQRF